MTKITRDQLAKAGLQAGGRRVLRPTGFKGSNFMSPEVAGFFNIGRYQVELSLGEFMGSQLFGGTVVQGHTNEYDLSGCCHSLEEVAARLEALK